jgi:hypothetical protein
VKSVVLGEPLIGQYRRGNRLDPPPGCMPLGVTRHFKISSWRANVLIYNALRPATRGRVAERYVGAAVAANGERSAGERQWRAERGKRRGSQLPQGSESLELWCVIHGFSHGFTVEFGKRHARLYHSLDS